MQWLFSFLEEVIAMELRVLKYFLMVAKEENITRAAKILHMTQPTLSRQLIQLETELGVKLFHRDKHKMVLTEDGLLLKRRAQEILSLTEKTKREFLQKGEELTGEISIGSGELKSTQFLMQAVAAFHKKYPRIHFEIYSGNSDNIKERIERGSLDLGLLLEPVDLSRYEFIQLPVREEWGILTQQDSELAAKTVVTPKDLVNIPLIFTQREMVQHMICNWFGEYADQMKIIASGNLLYNLAVMVRNQLGITINIKLDCKYEGVTYVPLSPTLESKTVLVWKKVQIFSPATTAFLEFFHTYIQQYIMENDVKIYV